MTILAVALGGALGSALRYGLGGVLAALFTTTEGAPALRAFLIPGLLGDYTTFSAFEYETVALVRSGDVARALLYVLSSIAAGLPPQVTWPAAQVLLDPRTTGC